MRKKKNKVIPKNAEVSSEKHGEIVVYKSEDGVVKLEVKLENETLWLTQQMMADLFGTSIPNVNMHIKNIIKEGELREDSVIKEFLTTASDNKNYDIKFYNMDMVISVGYRIKSLVATRFRIWATQTLKEYIIKGFVMDDERLKNPPVKGSFVPDYFDEMLARIRDIRTSERRVYLRVREIFAMAADYDPTDEQTNKFYSSIQNKLHFAATGMTAAEIIKGRADAGLINMGLTNWKEGEVRRTDVTTAKNYLKEDEIDSLNRIVAMWLDFAEDQAKMRKQVFLKDWEAKLNEFLVFNGRKVLSTAGSVSREQAEDHAHKEFVLFEKQRREEKEMQGLVDEIKQLEQASRKFGSKKKR
ncbi:MAG: virulence RhuM family protein [Candidatus Goldiibacteriota bacterium]|jgi:hypothetical protein